MDCDPSAYVPGPQVGGAALNPEEGGLARRSDSLPNPEIRGSSLPGRASMCSQASTSGLPLPPKHPLATLANILASEATEASRSPATSVKSTTKTNKEPVIKARVSFVSPLNLPSYPYQLLFCIFQIVDPLQVYDNINLGRRIDPLWPDEMWRSRGGRNNWKDWLPEEGMEGTVRALEYY